LLPKRRAFVAKPSPPFLLEQLARNSGGKTLETNTALLVANARLAAHVAVAYSALAGGS
jgi:pseudouridine-5'-phosphate glycosidase